MIKRIKLANFMSIEPYLWWAELVELLSYELRPQEHRGRDVLCIRDAVHPVRRLQGNLGTEQRDRV